jgi:hypothetical protein
MLGYDNCAFGMGLDQMYFSSKFSIPDDFKTRIIPAVDVFMVKN